MPMQHEHHSHGGMTGALGPWPMSQEGSGTTWLPASSPHYAIMLMPKWGPYMVHVMGTANAGYVDAGGKRGESQLFSNSMVMLQAARNTGPGTLALRGMFSLDPVFMGKRGVPNLFQTGETANGKPLKDRQHPHDLISELAASYSQRVGGDRRLFFYLGVAGEPALGNSMFLHRPSGMETPEAPISHHWFDSTHISYGVATAGLTLADKWKFEASAFNGHEPDENRYDIDKISLNSASGRITFNPNADTTLSASYGYLDSPEALEPGVNQHRITASVHLNKPMGEGRNLASALMFGRNIKHGDHGDAWNLETTYSDADNSVFLRYENVVKDELVDVPAGHYRIGKLVFGGVRNIARRDGLEYGAGAYVGLYNVPKALQSFYGKRPTTFGVFLRVRPGRM
ncbi:MAG: hypothetical protein QOJ65_1885 [Fimbriimonadaceae bacterium]|nr:hypothetical protein [Fimbriimonadaceae bacterium]